MYNLIERYPLLVVVSLNIDLKKRSDLESTLLKHGLSLKFISSKSLKRHCKIHTAHTALLGIANGTLYCVSSSFNYGALNSKKQLEVLLPMLTSLGATIYGIIWNSTLYTYKDLLDATSTKLSSFSLVKLHLIRYLYITYLTLSRFKVICTSNLHLNISEEEYVYN